MSILKPVIDLVVLGAFCTAAVVVVAGVSTLPAERGVIRLASEAR